MPGSRGSDEAEKRYDSICRQIEREDGLYQLRINACIIVNLALGATVAGQLIAGPMTMMKYIILSGACLIGYLITLGIYFSVRGGRRQSAILRASYEQLDTEWPGRFIRPYYADPNWTTGLRLGRLTGIPLLFQMAWAVAFLFISFIFFIGFQGM